MTTFLQRTLVFLLVAVLQYSFLDVLWPEFVAPALMISLVVSLVFFDGFERGGFLSLYALLFFALLGHEPVSFLLLGVLIAYGTSFLSRRLVTERFFQTSSILALVSVGSALLYILFTSFFERIPIDLVKVISNLLQVMIVFFPVFIFFRFWERRIKESFMSEFRGLRT